MVVSVELQGIDLSRSVGSVILQAKNILALNSEKDERKLVEFLFENLEHPYAKFLLTQMCNSSLYPLYPITYDHILELGDELAKSDTNSKILEDIEICREERKLNKFITVSNRKKERFYLEQVTNERNSYVMKEESFLPLNVLSIVIGQCPWLDKDFSDSDYVIMRHKPLEQFPSPMEYDEKMSSIELSYHTSFSDVDNDEPENVKVIQVSPETSNMLLNV